MMMTLVKKMSRSPNNENPVLDLALNAALTSAAQFSPIRIDKFYKREFPVLFTTAN